MYGLMISIQRSPGLARHLRAHGRVVTAVHALVLLELHRQVLPHDVLHRVLRLDRELVARRVLDGGLEVVRLPAELRDALVGLGDAAAAGRGAQSQSSSVPGHGATGVLSREHIGLLTRESIAIPTDLRRHTDRLTSSPPKRRRRSPESAEREILDAAESFLRERPFRDLTVDEVMARTTLSRPSFYVYFRDRHHLRCGSSRASAPSCSRWPSAGSAGAGDPRERRPGGVRGHRRRLRRARPGARRDRRRRRPRPGGRRDLPRPDRAIRGRDRRAHRGRHRAGAHRRRCTRDRARAGVDERALPQRDARPPPQAPVETVVETLSTVWVRVLYDRSREVVGPMSIAETIPRPG